MSSFKLCLAGAVSSLALVSAPVLAEAVMVKVPSTTMPWDLKANAHYSYGKGDGTAPAAAALTLAEGQKLQMTATGTTTTVGGGGAFGPDGQVDFITNDVLGNSGTFFPSKYVDATDYPTQLNELIGAFVDGNGRLVAEPFPVGRGYNGVVPKGAVTLEFGINDDIYADNTGEIDVTVLPVAEFADLPEDTAPVSAPAVPATTAAVVTLPPYPATPPAPIVLHADHNPIVSDGSYYSTDPAPIVVGDTLYILTGRDEAPIGVNDFIMNEWQVLATTDVASGDWKLYPHMLRPEKVFAWAEPARAYAGQIIQGGDKRFYLYAPVLQANCGNRDCFGVGVAVADSPLGPWVDAHPAGPIVSQSVPSANDIQNIDPTPFVDDDGRVYLYWGTFGQLRAIELNSDMVTPKGAEVSVPGLKGFFEAAWLFKRNKTYYLAYADNDTDPKDGCTPAVYHACIAYGTSSSPMGPWTYQGVVLPVVSSTTSHPGFVQFKGKWYITYHTAGAKDGGHFRRSVAIDEVKWDDSVSPARMIPVVPTPAAPTSLAAQRNIAPAADSHASNEPVPAQYWIAALNDGIVQPSPLPPDMWGTWNGHNPAQPWISYGWDQPVTLNESRLYFFNDQPAGSGVGVAVPRAWHLEYLDKGKWQPIAATYGTETGQYNDVTFAPVTTTCLRAVFDASTKDGTYAGVGVQEWEALAPDAQVVHLAAPQAGKGCPS